jgi:hypothetical protein
VVTTVRTTPGSPSSTAQDLFIDFGSRTIRQIAPGTIAGTQPNQPGRLVLTSDSRFLVGAGLGVNLSTPLYTPVTYRDLLSGAAGAIATGVKTVAANPRVPVIYVGFYSGEIGLLDVSGLRRVSVCAENSLSALAASRDGLELYVACFNSLRVLDAGTGSELRRINLAATPREMHAVAGSRLFTLDYAGPVTFAVMEMSIYDLTSGARLANVPTPVGNRGLSWAVPTPDGNEVLVGVGSSTSSADATPYLFSSLTLAVFGVWPIEHVTKAAFIAGGRRAVLLSEVPASGDTALHATLISPPTVAVLASAMLGYAGAPGVSTLAVIEPPLEPVNLASQVSGNRVSLSWVVPEASNQPSDFIIEAGSTPTSFNLLSQRIGSALPQFEAADVPAGTYYVRVRAVNAAGVGEPSPPIEVHVQ